MKAVVVLGVLTASCMTDLRGQAIERASVEHRCPQQHVRIDSVVAESRMDSEWAYWLDVCGSRRLYRYSATTGGRFQDQTGEVGGGS